MITLARAVRQLRGAARQEPAAAAGAGERSRAVDDHPDSPLWRWRVEGTGSGRNSMPPLHQATRADQSRRTRRGPWLVTSGPMWDCLDAREQFTITIGQAEEAGNADDR